MALSDTAVRNAQPRETPYKLTDGDGLTLLINPDGSKWWRLRYRIGGREKMLSLGVYPDVGLKRARERRDDARRQIADGVDPSAKRQAEKAGRANTFELVAREWLGLQANSIKASTHERETSQLERFVFPHVGARPIMEITAPEILAVLKRVENRGINDTAHRVRSSFSRIFSYAVVTGRADRNPTGDLRGALAPVVTKNYAAITEPARIGELLRAIDGYVGQPTTHAALKLAPLLFVRPGEIRAAEWREFTLDTQAPEWRIPGERMKMGEQHIVPLSRQAVEILRGLQPLTGEGRLLFPSLRTLERPISENTLNAALRRLGYSSDEMTGHGFRSMASTCLNEQGWHPDLIELQLAHAERNKVRAAYNRAQRLDERRKMMQAWADYLDRLRAGADVIALRRSA